MNSLRTPKYVDVFSVLRESEKRWHNADFATRCQPLQLVLLEQFSGSLRAWGGTTGTYKDNDRDSARTTQKEIEKEIEKR